MQLRPLHPFAAAAHLQGLDLRCGAAWHAGMLALHYRLSGPLAGLALPPRRPEPRRRDDLWCSTCFEAFLGVPGQAGYWEINLCPSGDWNLYALSGYRTGLSPEARIRQLPFSLRLRGDEPAAGGPGQQLDLELCLDLRGLIAAEAPLELSATAVLDHPASGCSHWAWHHAGPEADFHRRDSFQRIA
ncbi:MAG: DOMON-like domain-containing protein [Cyanobium sp.]